MSQPTEQPGSSDGALSFEDAMAEVERIIERIESGRIGLEASVAEYERGAVLLRRCQEVLARAELRVQTLERGRGEGPRGETPA